jgi:superfamily II DNA/RNA helicase
MPPEITRLVSQFLSNPERIEVAPPATTAKTITQLFQYCPNGEDWAKRDMLRQLIASQNVKNAIIFCNRKVDVAILHKSLVKHGFSAGALHGDMDQKSRMETLDKFRSGELKLLAASDVAARGLDIPDVSHIFNFDLPWQSDDYVHRIGRTGRAGKEGVSTSLVTVDELKSLRDIEKMLGEPAVWIGEAPSEQDYADAGKKRRGRGGRPGRGGGRSAAAPAQARGDNKGRQGERRGGQPKSGERQGEQREQRAPRREHHNDQPRVARQPDAQPTAHAAPARAPAAAAASGQNGHRHERPARPAQADARPAQAQRPERQRQPEPARSSGFADNVPAFLRKPVKRPAKVASE